MTNGETEAASVRPSRPRSITVASWLFLINGVFWGLFAGPYAIYISQLGHLPVTPAGFESMAGPLTDEFGYRIVVWLLIPLGLLSWLEVVAGWWLRGNRKEGGWLAILLLPVSMFFWISFVMPIWLALGPARVLLVLAGWKSLRHTARPANRRDKTGTAIPPRT